MQSGGFWLFTSDLCLRCFLQVFALWILASAQLDIGCDDENLQLWKHKSVGGKKMETDQWFPLPGDKENPNEATETGSYFMIFHCLQSFEVKWGLRSWPGDFFSLLRMKRLDLSNFFFFSSPVVVLTRLKRGKFHHGRSFHPNPEIGFFLKTQTLCHKPLLNAPEPY